MGVENAQLPIRSCIGCRERAPATALLRVVVAPEAAVRASGEQGVLGALPVVPDPRRLMPGRGAWLHRELACVELAQRRRAFARALRAPGPVDPTSVLDYVAKHYD